MIYLTFVNAMLDADAVINNSSQKVGGSGPRKMHGIYAPALCGMFSTPLVKIYGNAPHGLVT